METRVRNSQEIGPYIPARVVPIDHLLITATTSGTAQTLYTVRSGVMLKVKQLACVNVTGSAATLSLHAIPDGGTIGNSNAELLAVSVPANTAANLTDYVGGLYKAGAVLKVYAGTGSAIVIHGWAEEVL